MQFKFKTLVFVTILLSAHSISLKAAEYSDFYQHFNDSTLRIDYIFAGDSDGVGIYVESESKQPGWYGRRKKLNKIPAIGNGSILILEPSTNDTLYHNTFSSLFQEWLVSREENEKPSAFQNSFLLPLPKHKSLIKLELRDNRKNLLKEMTHIYNPEDELIEIRGNHPAEYEYIHKGGDPRNAIDIAILPEGFTEAETDTFIYHAKRFTDEILSYEPFSSNKDKFNFVAVKIPSPESGVSIPLRKEWKNTTFGSHFSTFHSPRYLTVPKLHDMHRNLEGIPYEHILVIVNTDEYGGGGIYNSYQVASSDNPLTLPVTVHEFGHSFAGLADEYFYADEEDEFYPLDVEPWEANITTLVDFNSKWADLVDLSLPSPVIKNDSIGDRTSQMDNNYTIQDYPIALYEGGGYRLKGIYRPTFTCRMRDNKYPKFCPVCEKEILSFIEFYTQ